MGILLELLSCMMVGLFSHVLVQIAEEANTALVVMKLTEPSVSNFPYVCKDKKNLHKQRGLVDFPHITAVF